MNESLTNAEPLTLTGANHSKLKAQFAELSRCLTRGGAREGTRGVLCGGDDWINNCPIFNLDSPNCLG